MLCRFLGKSIAIKVSNLDMEHCQTQSWDKIYRIQRQFVGDQNSLMITSFAKPSFVQLYTGTFWQFP
ncbi:MAG: hypothetical protein ACI9FJ_000363 [Alteromonadaceae bacterium]|jgi:hypothetical protein